MALTHLQMPVPSTNIIPSAYSHDNSCRITACSDGIRDTHIIPYDELEWVRPSHQMIIDDRIDILL